MELHSKFNIGDKVYLLYAHGQRNPIYVKTELFKDKNKKEEFEIESVRIEAGKNYCNINYRFKDFYEMFIPSEYNMFSTKNEALVECKNRNIKSLVGYRDLEKIFTHERKRTKKENEAYEQELKTLENT